MLNMLRQAHLQSQLLPQQDHFFGTNLTFDELGVQGVCEEYSLI